MFFFGFFHSFAKSLPYSAASFLFFLVHCLFKRNMGIYVSGQWNKVMLNDGALVPGCWPSLSQGFLTTYWLTLSSSARLKNVRILRALLGANCQYTVEFLSLGMFIHNVSPSWPAISLSISHWSITRMSLTHQLTSYAVDHDILLHGKALFIVSTTDSGHTTLPLFTQSTSSNFCGHVLLIRSIKLACIVRFNKFLTVSGK